jgi:hypothetical protein
LKAKNTNTQNKKQKKNNFEFPPLSLISFFSFFCFQMQGADRRKIFPKALSFFLPFSTLNRFCWGVGRENK